MGAVNYKTSDYITMGLKPYDFDDCKRDYLEWAATEAPELVNDDCIDDIVSDTISIMEYLNRSETEASAK